MIRLVETFYVDTGGATDYTDVRSICAEKPPMLSSVPKQALQCSLSGIAVVMKCGGGGGCKIQGARGM